MPENGNNNNIMLPKSLEEKIIKTFELIRYKMKSVKLLKIGSDNIELHSEDLNFFDLDYNTCCSSLDYIQSNLGLIEITWVFDRESDNLEDYKINPGLFHIKIKEGFEKNYQKIKGNFGSSVNILQKQTSKLKVIKNRDEGIYLKDHPELAYAIEAGSGRDKIIDHLIVKGKASLAELKKVCQLSENEVIKAICAINKTFGKKIGLIHESDRLIISINTGGYSLNFDRYIFEQY